MSQEQPSSGASDAQQQPPVPPGQTPPPETPDPPPRKRRRRWTWVLLALFLIPMLLVALAPTLISTGVGRSAIVGIVNDYINGYAEIGGLSLGWFSPIEAHDVKVYSEDKRLILDVPRAKINLSLINAIRQKFALGDDSQIDVASFIIHVDENGKTNLEKLPKAKSAAAPKPPTQQQVKVPDVSGKITINIAQGTIEGEGVKEPIHVEPSTAVVTISDINQPIQNQVKLAYHVGDSGATSTVQAQGTVQAIKNNILDIPNLSAGQNIALSNVNLAAAEPFLKALGEDTRLAGLMSGGVDLKAQGLTGVSANGEIVINGLSFGGGPLGADTFKTDKISIPVNITRTGEGNAAVIKFDNVGAQMSQASFKITGQVPEQAVLNLKDNKPPGGEGSITIAADITDLPNLAEQLKHTLKLQEGVKITGGAVHQKLVVNLTSDKVGVSQNLNIVDVKGTRNGKPIALQPITTTVDASAIPSGKPIPDVRDLRLALDSAFAKVTGGGASLAKILVNGNFDLGKLAAEAGQFVDLGVQLSGSGDFAVNTDGDLADENKPVALRANANLQNVKVIRPGSPGIDQDHLSLLATGTMTREKNVPKQITDGKIEVVGGDPKSPLIEVNADGTVDLTNMSVPSFDLKKCAITDLAKLQNEYGGVVPVLGQQQIKIESGSLAATASGAFDGKTVTLAKPASLSIPSLTVSKAGRPLLSKDGINAALMGSVSIKDGIAANLSDLSVTTDSKLFTLAKSADKPLTVNMKGNAVQGSGAMTLAADLPRLSNIAQAFGGQVSADQPKVTSGKLNGTLNLDKTIDLNAQIAGLTILLKDAKLIDNEQMTVAFNAKAPQDLSTVGSAPIEAGGSVKSSFVNTSLNNVKVALSGGILEMLQSANVDAQVPDLKKLVALVSAFSPVLGDLQVTSGDAAAKINVSRDPTNKATTIDIPNMQVNKLAIRQGDKSYSFAKPVVFKLNANIEGQKDISAVNVNDLSGDLSVASISMPEKIVITQPLSDKPSFKGSVKLDGKIEDVTPILAVLQGGEQMPYGGTYALNQQIMTSGNKPTLKGSIDVSDFRVMDKGKAVFTEPQLAVRNNLDVDLTNKKIAVQQLTVDMPKSQALSLSFVGGINDWDKDRKIREGTKLDLSYDLAKCWTIVQPMLSPEQQQSLADLKIAGKHQQTFVLSGAYPSRPTMAESIKYLNADGGFEVESLETMGLSIQNLQPEIKMRSGVVAITAKPATANGGRLDISGIKVDMTAKDPLLSTPSKKVLLKDVTLNPVLAGALGKAGAVVFSNASEAEGLLTVTINRCDKVPLGELIAKKRGTSAELVLQVEKLHLDGVVPKVISAAADLGTRGIEGRIPPSTITVGNGQADSNLTILIDREGRDARTGKAVMKGMPLEFKGGLGLEKLDLRNFTVSIAPELLIKQIRQIAPNGAVIALKGSATKPELDVENFIKENAIKNLIPGQGNGDNPLGGLLDKALGGGKDKKDGK
ncbi:MAG TPA: hypothetical protein VH518_11455 [Tepidisphaeraceae bacterium]|jgi:hypothetical protein